jgi:hypothetical protein
MIKCDSRYSGKNKTCADISVHIQGNNELIAAEYVAITMELLKSEGGQRILDRATDILKKEINDHEEKRRS